jgi:hypothetical protein
MFSSTDARNGISFKVATKFVAEGARLAGYRQQTIMTWELK